MLRAIISVVPPGANGTIKRIGRDGKVSAYANAELTMKIIQ